MSVRRIKGTFIGQLDPWFVDDKGALTPFAMTVVLKFDGAGHVEGKLVRRAAGDPLDDAGITGTYTLTKNFQFSVYEGWMYLLVGGSTNVTIYIVRRNAGEVYMNHHDVRDSTGAQVHNVAHGILRREQHSLLDWFFDPPHSRGDPIPPPRPD